MAFGANSNVFGAYLSESLNNDVAFALDADVLKAALFNNTTTPDETVAVGVTYHYNGAGSQWVTANEVIDTLNTNIVAGGMTIDTPVATHSGNTFTVDDDGTNTTHTGNVTIAAAFGTLVYDSTLAADNGICFNSFGGTQDVTNGTFTIVWNASGIFTIGY